MTRNRKIALITALSLLAAGAITATVLSFIPAYRVTPADLSNLTEDERFMAQAFAEIGKTNPADGYPVGAMVVREGKIIGRSSNRLFSTNNPTQHAEYRAVDEAIEKIQRQYPNEKYPDFFKDATVYVTLEPCPMDAGKITTLRFKKVVYCDIDEDWGGFGTVSSPSGFPHQVNVEQSTLPLCRQLRARPGWNFPELWELGKSYAQATNQVPSRLSELLRGF
ncbi:MAG: nucleoside deaminase [Patescibacteria group bacterium]